MKEGSRMVEKAKCLGQKRNLSANPEFLREYQQAVMLTLRENGVLTSDQLDKCINPINNQRQ